MLEPLYPKIGADNWYLAFLITEFVGIYYRNEEALNMFIRLSGIDNETGRSFIPHGFEHIVTDSGDPRLAAIAEERLKLMANDSSEKVRGEVEESFQRIKLARSR